jgi:hypothetical protein
MVKKRILLSIGFSYRFLDFLKHFLGKGPLSEFIENFELLSQ